MKLNAKAKLLGDYRNGDLDGILNNTEVKNISQNIRYFQTLKQLPYKVQIIPELKKVQSQTSYKSLVQIFRVPSTRK